MNFVFGKMMRLINLQLTNAAAGVPRRRPGGSGASARSSSFSRFCLSPYCFFLITMSWWTPASSCLALVLFSNSLCRYRGGHAVLEIGFGNGLVIVKVLCFLEIQFQKHRGEGIDSYYFFLFRSLFRSGFQTADGDIFALDEISCLAAASTTRASTRRDHRPTNGVVNLHYCDYPPFGPSRKPNRRRSYGNSNDRLAADRLLFVYNDYFSFDKH